MIIPLTNHEIAPITTIYMAIAGYPMKKWGETNPSGPSVPEGGAHEVKGLHFAIAGDWFKLLWQHQVVTWEIF